MITKCHHIRAAPFLDNIKSTLYYFGMGSAKGDEKTGQTKLYPDVIIRSKSGT